MRAVAGPRWLGVTILLSLLCSAALVVTRLSGSDHALLQVLADRLPLTTLVTLSAPALSGLLGVGFGLVSADRGEWNERSLRVFLLSGCALCLCWGAVVGTLWVAIGTELGPLAAGVPVGVSHPGTRTYLLIPAVIVVLGAAVAIAVIVRATARQVARQEFLQTMRSRGLPTTAVVTRRTLRAAALPILAVLATELLIGYAVALAVQAVLVNPSLADGMPETAPVDSLPVVLGLGLVGATAIVIAGAAAAAARFGGPFSQRPPRSAAVRGRVATLLDDQQPGRGRPSRVTLQPSPTLPSTSFRSADLLDVRGLRFRAAADVGVSSSAGISLTVPRGEALAVLGDDRSGAAALGLAIAGLLPAGTSVSSGSILVDGNEIVGLPERDFGRLRGHHIGYLAAPGPNRLDPRSRIGDQVFELLARQAPAAKAEVRQRAVDLFARVGINDPEGALRAYPHQVDAETAHRALLAGALALRPRLLIVHEPTRGFEAAAGAVFLDLLHEVQREAGFTLIVISARVEPAVRCDRVAVMRAGTVVEYASAADLFTAGHHPRTGPLLTGADDGPAHAAHRDAEPSAQP
jgi:ABC-type dipeptide/oligopeptide/nickel transport system ATPase component/ABC-type dipeptide/oligopeptide/nickel transport system permease component